MKEIKKLLEKYYNGDTSLEEERELVEFFLSGKVPPELKEHKAQFEFYEREKDQQPLGEDFDEKIMDMIKSDKIYKFDDGSQELADRFAKNEERKTKTNSQLFYRIAGIAAGLAIIFGIYLTYFDKPLSDTNVAMTEKEKHDLEVTIEAFSKASKYINLANTEMEKMSVIDNAMEQINKISYYDKYNKLVFKYLGAES